MKNDTEIIDDICAAATGDWANTFYMGSNLPWASTCPEKVDKWLSEQFKKNNHFRPPKQLWEYYEDFSIADVELAEKKFSKLTELRILIEEGKEVVVQLAHLYKSRKKISSDEFMFQLQIFMERSKKILSKFSKKTRELSKEAGENIRRYWAQKSSE